MDIQKIVTTMKAVPEFDPIGNMNAAIDADWHPDHLKPDSTAAYDIATNTLAAELAPMDRIDKYSAIGDLVDALTSDEDIPDWQKEKILDWAGNIRLDSFKPDVVVQAELPNDPYGFSIAD